MFMPKTPLNLAFFKFLINWSMPTLLKPNLLIMPSFLINLKDRGLILPGWLLGVTVPTSMKPNPSLERGVIYSAFLSNPAASPTLFGNFSPIIVIGLECVFLFLINPKKQASFKPFIDIWWANSGLNKNKKNLMYLYIFF